MLIDVLIARQEPLAASGDPQALTLLEKLRERKAYLGANPTAVVPVNLVANPVPGTILNGLFAIDDTCRRVPFPDAALAFGVAQGWPISLAVKAWHDALDPDPLKTPKTPCPYTMHELLDEVHWSEGSP